MDITSNPASPADNVNEYHNRDIALFNKDLSLYKNFALRMSSSWYPSNPGNANGLYDRALDMQSFLYTSGSDEYVLAIYWDHHSGYDFIGGVIFNPSIQGTGTSSSIYYTTTSSQVRSFKIEAFFNAPPANRVLLQHTSSLVKYQNSQARLFSMGFVNHRPYVTKLDISNFATPVRMWARQFTNVTDHTNITSSDPYSLRENNDDQGLIEVRTVGSTNYILGSYFYTYQQPNSVNTPIIHGYSLAQARIFLMTEPADDSSSPSNNPLLDWFIFENTPYQMVNPIIVKSLHISSDASTFKAVVGNNNPAYRRYDNLNLPDKYDFLITVSMTDTSSQQINNYVWLVTDPVINFPTTPASQVFQAFILGGKSYEVGTTTRTYFAGGQARYNSNTQKLGFVATFPFNNRVSVQSRPTVYFLVDYNQLEAYTEVNTALSPYTSITVAYFNTESTYKAIDPLWSNSPIPTTNNNGAYFAQPNDQQPYDIDLNSKIVFTSQMFIETVSGTYETVIGSETKYFKLRLGDYYNDCKYSKLDIVWTIEYLPLTGFGSTQANFITQEGCNYDNNDDYIYCTFSYGKDTPIVYADDYYVYIKAYSPTLLKEVEAAIEIHLIALIPPAMAAQTYQIRGSNPLVLSRDYFAFQTVPMRYYINDDITYSFSFTKISVTPAVSIGHNSSIFATEEGYYQNDNPNVKCISQDQADQGTYNFTVRASHKGGSFAELTTTITFKPYNTIYRSGTNTPISITAQIMSGVTVTQLISLANIVMTGNFSSPVFSCVDYIGSSASLASCSLMLSRGIFTFYQGAIPNIAAPDTMTNSYAGVYKFYLSASHPGAGCSGIQCDSSMPKDNTQLVTITLLPAYIISPTTLLQQQISYTILQQKMVLNIPAFTTYPPNLSLNFNLGITNPNGGNLLVDYLPIPSSLVSYSGTPSTGITITVYSNRNQDIPAATYSYDLQLIAYMDGLIDSSNLVYQNRVIKTNLTATRATIIPPVSTSQGSFLVKSAGMQFTTSVFTSNPADQSLSFTMTYTKAVGSGSPSAMSVLPVGSAVTINPTTVSFNILSSSNNDVGNWAITVSCYLSQDISRTTINTFKANFTLLPATINFPLVVSSSPSSVSFRYKVFTNKKTLQLWPLVTSPAGLATSFVWVNSGSHSSMISNSHFTFNPSTGSFDIICDENTLAGSYTIIFSGQLNGVTQSGGQASIDPSNQKTFTIIIDPAVVTGSLSPSNPLILTTQVFATNIPQVSITPFKTDVEPYYAGTSNKLGYVDLICTNLISTEIIDSTSQPIRFVQDAYTFSQSTGLYSYPSHFEVLTPSSNSFSGTYQFRITAKLSDNTEAVLSTRRMLTGNNFDVNIIIQPSTISLPSVPFTPASLKTYRVYDGIAKVVVNDFILYPASMTQSQVTYSAEWRRISGIVTSAYSSIFSSSIFTYTLEANYKVISVRSYNENDVGSYLIRITAVLPDGTQVQAVLEVQVNLQTVKAPTLLSTDLFSSSNIFQLRVQNQALYEIPYANMFSTSASNAEMPVALSVQIAQGTSGYNNLDASFAAFSYTVQGGRISSDFSLYPTLNSKTNSYTLRVKFAVGSVYDYMFMYFDILPATITKVALPQVPFTPNYLAYKVFDEEVLIGIVDFINVPASMNPTYVVELSVFGGTFNPISTFNNIDIVGNPETPFTYNPVTKIVKVRSLTQNHIGQYTLRVKASLNDIQSSTSPTMTIDVREAMINAPTAPSSVTAQVLAGSSTYQTGVFSTNAIPAYANLAFKILSVSKNGQPQSVAFYQQFISISTDIPTSPGQYTATLKFKPVQNVQAGNFVVALRAYLPDNQDYTFFMVPLTIQAAQFTSVAVFSPSSLSYYKVYDGLVKVNVTNPSVSPANAGVRAFWQFSTDQTNWVSTPQTSAMTTTNDANSQPLSINVNAVNTNQNGNYYVQIVYKLDDETTYDTTYPSIVYTITINPATIQTPSPIAPVTYTVLTGNRVTFIPGFSSSADQSNTQLLTVALKSINGITKYNTITKVEQSVSPAFIRVNPRSQTQSCSIEVNPTSHFDAGTYTVTIEASLPDGTSVPFSVKYIINNAVITPSTSTVADQTYPTFLALRSLNTVTFTSTATVPTETSIVVDANYFRVAADGSLTPIVKPSFFTLTSSGASSSPLAVLGFFSEKNSDAGLYRIQLFAYLQADGQIKSSLISFNVTVVPAMITPPTSSPFSPAGNKVYRVFDTPIVVALAQSHTTTATTQSLSYSVMVLTGVSTLSSLPDFITVQQSPNQVTISKSSNIGAPATFTLVYVAQLSDGTKDLTQTFKVNLIPAIINPSSPLSSQSSPINYKTFTPTQNFQVNPYPTLPLNVLVTYQLVWLKSSTQEVELTATSTGAIKFNPSTRQVSVTSNNYNDQGTYTLKVIAKLPDGTNDQSQTFSVIITPASISIPSGSLTSPQGPLTYNVMGDQLDVVVNAFSTSGSISSAVLTYTMSSTPSNSALFTFDPVGRVVQIYTQKNGDAKLYLVRITASLPDGSSNYADFEMSVSKAVINPPFQLASTIVYKIYQYTLNVVTIGNFIASPNSVLSYSLKLSSGASLPSFIQFDPLVTPLKITIVSNRLSDIGNYNLVLTATIDNLGDSVSNTNTFITTTVSVQPYVIQASLSSPFTFSYMVNADPALFNVPQFESYPAGAVLQYQATLDDGSALPSFMNYDVVNQKLSMFAISNENAGAYNVMIVAFAQELPSIRNLISVTVTVNPTSTSSTVTTPNLTPINYNVRDSQVQLNIPAFTTVPTNLQVVQFDYSISEITSTSMDSSLAIVLSGSSYPYQLQVYSRDMNLQGTSFWVKFRVIFSDGNFKNDMKVQVNFLESNVQVIAPLPSDIGLFTYQTLVGNPPLVVVIPAYATSDNDLSLGDVSYSLQFKRASDSSFTSAVPISAVGSIVLSKVSATQMKVTISTANNADAGIFTVKVVPSFSGFIYSTKSVTFQVTINAGPNTPNFAAASAFLQKFMNSGDQASNDQWMCQVFKLRCSASNSLISNLTLPSSAQTINNVGYCPGAISTKKASCSWNSFFSAALIRPGEGTVNGFHNSLSNSWTQILVCTNSMPPHALSAADQAAQAPFYNEDTSTGYVCFSAPFNVRPNELPEPVMNTNLSVNISNMDISYVLCNPQWATPSTMHPSIGAQYQETRAGIPLPNLNQVVGIAFNGVLIYSSTSDLLMDVFNAKAWANNTKPILVNVDLCLGSSFSQVLPFYHYSSFSPCIFTNQIQQISGVCRNTSACAGKPLEYAINQTVPSYIDGLKPVALAKDGRVIYGPYKESGKLWQPCDVDICNGVFLANGEYGYASTTFFPYTVGCWGPGPKVSAFPSCTTAPRKCGASLSSARVLAGSILSLVVILICSMF